MMPTAAGHRLLALQYFPLNPVLQRLSSSLPLRILQEMAAKTQVYSSHLERQRLAGVH